MGKKTLIMSHKLRGNILDTVIKLRAFALQIQRNIELLNKIYGKSGVPKALTDLRIQEIKGTRKLANYWWQVYKRTKEK